MAIKKLNYIHDKRRTAWFRCAVRLNIPAFTVNAYAFCCQDKGRTKTGVPNILILMPVTYLKPKGEILRPPDHQVWHLWTYSQENAKLLFSIDEKVKDSGQEYLEKGFKTGLQFIYQDIDVEMEDERLNFMVIPNLAEVYNGCIHQQVLDEIEMKRCRIEVIINK